MSRAVNLLSFLAALAIVIGLGTLSALADAQPGNGGTLNPSATPEILRVDPMILETGERRPDLSDMRNALPH